MFEFNGSRSVYDRAEIEKIIIEGQSVTIAFKEGYEEEGVFVPVGSDHIVLSKTDAESFIAGLGAEKDKTLIIKKAETDAGALVAKVRTPVVEE